MPDAPGELEPEGGASYTPGTPGGLTPEGGGAATPGDPGNLTPNTPASPSPPPSITPSTPPSPPTGTQWASQAEAEAGLSEGVIMSPLRTKQAIGSLGTPRDSKEHTIITAGDSVMSANALGDAFYLDRLSARSERFRNATLVDGGVPGSLILTTEGTIEDLLEPYENPPEQTKLIVLLGTAINDITSGRTAAQALASMQACCDLIRAAGGLCAAFSCPGTFAFQATIDDYNELLRSAYADGDFDFLIDIARIPYTVTDYVHPDAAGCELITDELLRSLGGFPMAAPDSFQLGLKTSLAITAISVATSAEVTVTGHGLTTGQVVHITGTNSTPTIDGIRQVTVTGPNTFTVAVTTTVAGTTGSVNTATALLASGVPYNLQHTWLLQTLNDNANGANAETFLATGGYNTGANPFSLQLHSIAFFNGGAGEASPIFDSGYIQTHPTLAFYLVNKSSTYTYRVFPTLLGNSTL